MKYIDENYINISSGKIHFLICRYEEVTADIESNVITFENKKELDGIIIDFKYSIENHINIFRKRTSQKLYTLEKVSAFATS